MGDNSYYQNQFNPFMAQNYGYSQPQQQPGSFYPNMPPQGGGFSVNTSMPMYNAAAATFNQSQSSGPQQDQDGNPSPSYQNSPSDSVPNTNERYSPAWSYINKRGRPNQKTPNNSFTNLFDNPGETRTARKSPDWSSDNYNSSQSFQEDPQGRFNPHNSFSQQPTTNFSSDYGGQSDYKFSPYNQRGFGRHNQNRGKGRGGFRGRGNRQNRGRSGNRDFNKKVQGSRDEGNMEGGDNGDYEASEKVNAFIPDPLLVKKYEFYPPSAEEMGEMFKDLVIHFMYKLQKNKKERNPFVVVCEAFRRSTGYCNLEVEDGYGIPVKEMKFCTLRYCGMMLVRGVGENNCLKEPRVLAGIELINKLAMSCYTLESKEEYHSVNAFQEMIKAGSVPNVYIIAPKEVAYDFDSARNYLQLEYSKEDSDVEYLFQFSNMKEALKLKGWANKQYKKCDVRFIKDEWVGVCRQRTPQYWRDKILASGSMESGRFILKPPQGIGNLLIKDYNIKDLVVPLKARPLKECSLQNVYGPPGVGPKISTALPPWERGGNRKSQKKQQKERKIMNQIKQGVPPNEVKGFKFLSKRKKDKLMGKLGK